MNRKAMDIISVVGLLICATAVADLLTRWDNTVLLLLYFIWGVASAAMVAIVLLAYKVRQQVQEVCRGGAPLPRPSTVRTAPW